MNLGVNMMGSNWYGDLSSAVLGKHYFFPTPAELDYYAAQGFDHIRLPLAWERLQPQLNGQLDASYVKLIEDTVSYAKTLGIDVVLDIHNYGSYKGNLIGTAAVPNAAFADMWGKLASEFADAGNVRFGLMNEPQQKTAAEWVSAANAAIDAIRDAGAMQEILVGSTFWGGAHKWTTTENAKVIGAPGAIVDPAGNFAFELHQYLDDGSGSKDWVVSETIGVERLKAATEWARANDAKLYLGEFGVADNPQALAALDKMLAYMAQNADVWEGAAYWGAGRANPDYLFSATPDLGILDNAQMNVLEKYTEKSVKLSTDAQGHAVQETSVSTDDGARVSMRDVYDAGGKLIARTVYDADGDVRTEYTLDKGLHTVTTYTIAGQDLPAVTNVYNAAQQLLSRATADATGLTVVDSFEPGNPVSNKQDVYDKSGILIQTVTHLADGHEIARYTNGKLATDEHYTIGWKLLSRDTYDAQERLTLRQVDHADGSHTKDQFDVKTGVMYRSTDYASNWDLVSVSDYDAVSGRLKQVVTRVDGLREIESYGADGHTLVSLVVTTEAGQQLNRTDFSSAGSVKQTFAGAGSSVLAKVETFDADGDLVKLARYDAQGKISTVETIADNGVRTIESYLPGTSLVSQVQTVDGQGHVISVANYEGGKLKTVSANQADGSVVVDTYGTPGAEHASLREIRVDGKVTSKTSFDTEGQKVSATAYNADGSLVTDKFAGDEQLIRREVFGSDGKLQSRTEYGADGQATLVETHKADGSGYIDTFSDGHITGRTQLDTAGKITAIDRIESDGGHLVTHFNAATGKTTMVEDYTSGWKLESRTSFDDAGKIKLIQIDRADGTHIKETYTAANQAHPAYVDEFSSDWAMVQRTYLDTSGRVTSIGHVRPEGGTIAEHFNAATGALTSVEVFGAGNKFEKRVSYDANGDVTMVQLQNADNSVTKQYYTAANQDHPSYIDHFSTPGVMTSRTYLNADGLVTRINSTEPDGTKMAIYFSTPGSELASKIDIYSSSGTLVGVRYPAEEAKLAALHQSDGFDFSSLGNPATDRYVHDADALHDAVVASLLIDVVHVPHYDLMA